MGAREPGTQRKKDIMDICLVGRGYKMWVCAEQFSLFLFMQMEKNELNVFAFQTYTSQGL